MGSKKLKVLSLFSGCGGMNLGFMGNFSVLDKSINSIIHPSWNTSLQKQKSWIKLPKTVFETVFANRTARGPKILLLDRYEETQIPHTGIVYNQVCNLKMITLNSDLIYLG